LSSQIALNYISGGLGFAPLALTPKKEPHVKWIIIAISLWVSAASAGNQHTMAQIDTCYHWLTPAQLQPKIDFAESNRGELYFYGGAPVYCWRSPLGAYSAWEAHGDVLIRIKFKPGTKITTAARSNYFREMGSPVVYSNNNRWHEYTITPDAVESWSMYHPNMIMEMKAEMQFYKAGLATADDVFYPFTAFDLNYLNQQIPPIIAAHIEGSKKDFTRVYGKNVSEHFKTSYPLPWQKYLVRGEMMKVVPLPEIKIVEASYGANVDRNSKGNATEKAGKFCDGNTSCTYKVHPRFIGDPAPNKEKDFEIAWTCSNKAGIQRKKIDAPADGKVLELECGK
jgi:hypothetical protein